MAGSIADVRAEVRIQAALLLALAAWAVPVQAQPQGFNYDESAVPSYELPEILRAADGSAVDEPAKWPARRDEILGLFEREVYGAAPPSPSEMRFETLDEDPRALGGLARRKQVRITFGASEQAPGMDLLLYTPAGAQGQVPTFLGLNFRGNHTVHPDSSIRLADSVTEVGVQPGSEEDRGRSASRWPIERALERGYGVATVYSGHVDPDFDDGFRNGVHALRPPRSENDWGTIAGWAWGLSRALDYLQGDRHVDGTRVAVLGHSRLGKTALWAGAADERFAIVISNNSGCGGAALSRRRFGETVERINTRFPHWFADRFNAYNGREDDLPVDQHMLLALIAPRPLYVASAEEDLWADPRGEYLSARHASVVYELLGGQGLGDAPRPPLNRPVLRDIGYHIREGKHDITAYDWERYMDFADLHWRDDRR